MTTDDGDVYADGVVLEHTSDDVKCEVEVAGSMLPTSLPLYAMPPDIYPVGKRFRWKMRANGEVLAADIKPLGQPTLTPDEEAEADRLYTEMMRDLLQGKPVWSFETIENKSH